MARHEIAATRLAGNSRQPLAGAIVGAISALAVSFTPSGTAGAHHAGVMFEESAEVTVNGVVKEFQYTNPHSWLLVDVTGEDGTVTTWGFEAEGPSTLMRRGIRPGDLTPGTKLTVSGRPMKDGRPAAAWTKAVRDDGAEFFPRGQ